MRKMMIESAVFQRSGREARAEMERARVRTRSESRSERERGQKQPRSDSRKQTNASITALASISHEENPSNFFPFRGICGVQTMNCSFGCERHATATIFGVILSTRHQQMWLHLPSLQRKDCRHLQNSHSATRYAPPRTVLASDTVSEALNEHDQA